MSQQLHHPVYGHRKATSSIYLDIGCIQAASFDSVTFTRHLQTGKAKRASFGILIEGMLLPRSRMQLCLHRRLEGKCYPALAPSFYGKTCIREQHREAWIFHSTRSRCRAGYAIVCKCSLLNLLKKGFSTYENEEQRKKDRQRALLSLFAQAMVASHIPHSPVFSFLWANWPNMVSYLSAAGHAGGHGKRNLSTWQDSGIREPGYASFSVLSHWKVLLLGFFLGTLISMILTSTVSVGALLDGCFWLCLLCSLVFPVACCTKAIFSTVMLIAGRGLMSLSKDLETTLRRDLLACARTFTGGLWLRDIHSKHRHQAPYLSVASMWSRQIPRLRAMNWTL